MSEAIKIITTNRKARHDFRIEENLEAGLVLQGSEVKSLREGRVNLQEGYCRVVGGEMLLFNCHISPYTHGSEYNNHDPLRVRKLLLHRREIAKWKKAVEQQGYTIVPLKVYFKNGYAKVEIGLAKGKKLYDKRHDIAKQETERRLKRVLRGGEVS